MWKNNEVPNDFNFINFPMKALVAFRKLDVRNINGKLENDHNKKK